MTTTMKTMELTLTRTIPAPPAEVFGAWMDPTHPGNPCRFLAVERNKRVQHAWMSPFTRGLESFVTVTFEKKGDDTLMTLNHASLPDDETGRVHEGGWNHCLDVFGEQFSAGRPESTQGRGATQFERTARAPATFAGRPKTFSSPRARATDLMEPSDRDRSTVRDRRHCPFARTSRRQRSVQRHVPLGSRAGRLPVPEHARSGLADIAPMWIR